MLDVDAAVRWSHCAQSSRILPKVARLLFVSDDLGPLAGSSITSRRPERVNVGCGPTHHLPGWWNTDIRDFPGVDQVMDAAVPWPFPRESLSYVYGEHFLEHLEVLDAVRFLGYAGEALQIGGRLRLSTPNLEWVVATHFRLEAPDEERWADTLKINRAFYGWGHRFLWSQELLERALELSGYVDITFHRYGESAEPQLRGLERHGGYSATDMRPSVLIAEAVRDGTPWSAVDEFADWLREGFVRHVAGGH